MQETIDKKRVQQVIERIKNQVAEEYGYEDNVLGTRWEFAMQLTHRTKRQIQLYEAVIALLGDCFTQSLHKMYKAGWHDTMKNTPATAPCDNKECLMYQERRGGT